MTSWTPERRAAQAERIRANKPWLKSTGPRTKTGKKKSSQNARKTGSRAQENRDAARALRLHAEFMKLVDVLLAAECGGAQTNYRKNPGETTA